MHDTVIIGAGINGAGIARDAAMRGLKVLLLDKSDLASGTTSYSTRLIHGGLRYLEHGEVGLVRESLREREVLLRIAPHLVRPLPLLIPIYEHQRRGPWTIRAGMIAYDLLSRDKSLLPHQMLSGTEVSARVPGLNPTGLRGAAIFVDAQIEFAERLVLENVLSAVAHGAVVQTYTRVTKISHDEFWQIDYTDELSGASGTIQARTVINAAGPWVDEILNFKDEPLIGGTKGSHIIVAPFRGAPPIALYVEAEHDARPFFVIPWNGNFLIGTTDIRFEGAIDDVEISEQEIGYLLSETNRLFPQANLSPADILFSYAGIRPLAFTKDKTEAGITRRHFIREQADLLSIVGGKLTTYRQLAEETVNLLFKKLQRNDPGCETMRIGLPGANEDFAVFSKHFSEESPFDLLTNERLLRIYGTRAGEVAKFARKNAELAEVFDSESGAIAAEICFSFQSEFARTLKDCLLRRTMLGLNSHCGLNLVDRVAAIAGKHLGWDQARREIEIKDYHQAIKRFRVRDISERAHSPSSPESARGTG